MLGYVGKIATSDHIVWKTEGVTDALAILSLDPPDHHTATCNACGAGEKPSEYYLKQFAGKDVFVIHDCDQPGQSGAVGAVGRSGWAQHIAKYAASVRNVVLPYEIAPNHGPDVRDYIAEKKPTYQQLLDYAMACPVIEAGEVAEFVESNEEEPESSLPEKRKPNEAPDDPHRLAKINLAVYESEHGGKLVYWRQQWWKYRDGKYRQISESELAAKVNASIKREFDGLWQEENDRYEAWVESQAYDESSDKGPPKARQVKRVLVNNVIDALKAICLLSNKVQMPSWLEGRTQPKLISVANGLLSLDELFKPESERDDEKIMQPHDHRWFSPVRLPYEFDRNADCPKWKSFLDDVFSGDVESIEAVQKWFGYLLLPDTSLHKMMFIIGKPRSGKGTLMRTLVAMLGRDTVASPTLSDFADRFALQGIADKTAAVIGDVRLSARADDTMITERILAITGEDPQDVHRKHLEPLLGVQLPLRFTLFSNQLPQLNDSSAALMTRCIFVKMPNCYVGKEDRSLGKKLEKELSGILNWAIAGRYYLQRDGEIEQPSSGQEMKERMERLTAPVSFFLRQCCNTERGSVEISDLYTAWETWSEENQITWKLDIQRFCRKVHDAIPNVKTVRSSVGGFRSRKFEGISLLQDNSF